MLAADKTTESSTSTSSSTRSTRETRKGLQNVIQGFAAQYDGKGREANESAKYFNPALSTTRRLVDQLDPDEGDAHATSSSTPRSAVTALAERRDDLAELVGNANATAAAIGARERRARAGARPAADHAARGNTTFVNLRATLDDLDVLVDASKPATRELAPFLRELRPLVARRAARRSATCALLVTPRGADNDLRRRDAQAPAPPAGRDARRFANSTQALRKSQPVLEFIRPYAPELVGWFRDFGQGAAELRRQRPLRAHPADLQRVLRSPTTRPAAC